MRQCCEAKSYQCQSQPDGKSLSVVCDFVAADGVVADGAAGGIVVADGAAAAAAGTYFPVQRLPAGSEALAVRGEQTDGPRADRCACCWHRSIRCVLGWMVAKRPSVVVSILADRWHSVSVDAVVDTGAAGGEALEFCRTAGKFVERVQVSAKASDAVGLVAAGRSRI